MSRPASSVIEIEIKIEIPQLEFLKSKARELGISKEELLKQYIPRIIDAERTSSLEGIFKGSAPITEAAIDGVIEEWNSTESP